MRFKIQNSGLKIALFGVMILICFLMNGCRENANAGSIKTNTDSLCLAGIKSAKRDVKDGKYSVYIPDMSYTLSPYAEEMFDLYYHKKVDVKNTNLMICGTGREEEEVKDHCYNHYMDSIVSKFGPNVFEKIKQGAQELYDKEPTRYNSEFSNQAQFPGGDSALHNALAKNIHYPAAAKRDSVMGTVYVRINVDSTGKITNAEIVKSARADLDSAAIAGVMKLPNFIPPLSRGKKIPSSTIVPIRFKLQ